MSVRSSNSNSSGRGGRGDNNNNSRGGRGRGGGAGRGQHYTGAASTAKIGMCPALGVHVFDYGQKATADQMKTSWEKLVQHVGTNYGQDIANELQNKVTVTIPPPTYSAATLTRHQTRETLVRTGQSNLQAARKAEEKVLRSAVAGKEPGAAMQLATLLNDIAMGEFQATEEVPIELTDSEKTQYSNESRTYRERVSKLETHRGQVYSLILGQCTQLLHDKLKQAAEWTKVSTSYNPLTLFRLIEKTVLAQTEDQYPFATVYDQEHALYSFRQELMTNAQWYEKFNTRVDVGEAIGVTRQHKVLLEFVAQETHNQAFTALGAVEQAAVRDDAEERYRSYVFLKQSGGQHGHLKQTLQNDFTTGDNHYPKNRQQALHLLDKFSKTVVPKAIESEGTAFAQDGGGRKGKPFDKEYWKDKECFKCHKLGHPASHCKQKDKDDDDQSIVSTESTKSTVSKLKKEVKKMHKKFAAVHTQLQQLQEAASDASDLESEEEHSHFQFQFTQIGAEFRDDAPAASPGKTTRSKPAPVAKDFVRVPTELLQLHNQAVASDEDDAAPVPGVDPVIVDDIKITGVDGEAVGPATPAVQINRASRNKRMKHITDRISKSEVTLKWCPTEGTTKAIPGALFQTFRDQIMEMGPEIDPGPHQTQPHGKTETVEKTPRKGAAGSNK